MNILFVVNTRPLCMYYSNSSSYYCNDNANQFLFQMFFHERDMERMLIKEARNVIRGWNRTDEIRLRAGE